MSPGLPGPSGVMPIWEEPARPATVTTELTLPPLDESDGDPSGGPSESGG
jgi:hypothetical protein